MVLVWLQWSCGHEAGYRQKDKCANHGKNGTDVKPLCEETKSKVILMHKGKRVDCSSHQESRHDASTRAQDLEHISLDWIHRAHLSGYLFSPELPSRDTIHTVYPIISTAEVTTSLDHFPVDVSRVPTSRIHVIRKPFWCVASQKSRERHVDQYEFSLAILHDIAEATIPVAVAGIV
jgi:hypothetical protein